MFWKNECTERKKQTECSAPIWTSSAQAAGVFATGNHGHQQTSEMAALQNALNNVFLVDGRTAAQPPNGHSIKIGCSTSVAASSSSLSSAASTGGRLPVKCDRYKTELCRTYEENGTCRYGDKCQFAHGVAELRTVARHPKYKTDLCRTFHTTGFCPYGSRCHFIHSLHERQLPIQQSTLQVHAANLLLPQLAAAKSRPLAPMNSQMVAGKQSLDNLLHTLSSLIGADHIATSLLAQEHARKLTACQSAAECLPRGTLPGRLSHFSDTTSIPTEPASPCPSPTSLNGVHDDFVTSRSYFDIKSSDHFPQNTGFQSPVPVPAGMLSPPNSPGSAASSLNSLSSDYEGCDWSRGVWPALLSPVKGIDVSLLPEFAHSQLLTAKHSVLA